MEANLTIPDWHNKLKNQMVEEYGEEYAERVLHHITFAMCYQGYGAPGHMHYVTIQQLIKYINNNASDKTFDVK